MFRALCTVVSAVPGLLLAVLLSGATLTTSSHAEAQGPGERDYARQVVLRAKRTSPRMLRALFKARRAGVATMEVCLDRTLTEVHSVLRQIERHSAAMENAKTPSETARRKRALQLLDERIKRLGERARACGGDKYNLKSGETRVEVIQVARK